MTPITEMVIWCAWFRETEVEQQIIDLGCGAGETDCLECIGTGEHLFGPELIPDPICIDCKGTGKILVAI